MQDFILRLWSEVMIQASTKTHARVHAGSGRVESVAGSDWAARCMACDIHGEWDQLWKMNMHFMLVWTPPTTPAPP